MYWSYIFFYFFLTEKTKVSDHVSSFKRIIISIFAIQSRVHFSEFCRDFVLRKKLNGRTNQSTLGFSIHEMKIIREQSQPTNWFKSKHKETSTNDYWLLYYLQNISQTWPTERESWRFCCVWYYLKKNTRPRIFNKKKKLPWACTYLAHKKFKKSMLTFT